MNKPTLSMAQQVALAASAFQLQQTGHTPQGVSAVVHDDILVIVVQGALSPAEKTLAKTPAGAANVQELHRQLFDSSAEALRVEIKRITGVAVRESASEVQPVGGAVVHLFSTGSQVQVFQLENKISPETWNKCEVPRPKQGMPYMT